ncbi:MAG TPA: glycosyltransferase family 2 protein [Chlamydiales bacterium]|nr:glycosyltransferase family 2 protein [Chlamydiales bacterium]
MVKDSSHHTTSNKILIVLVNWNGKKDTLECLASLRQVQYSNFTTVIVDNGSSDDSVMCIREKYPSVPIFETKENLGFAGGNNVAIVWALKKDFDWILLLNNDTIVDPYFLHEFMAAAKLKPKAKILGAKIYRYHDPLRIDHLGGTWNAQIGEFESHCFAQVDDRQSYEEMRQVDYVCGAALLMHRSVPETIGTLEKDFFLFWEETDFCCRARRAGLEVWTAPKAKIWHKVSSSFTGGKPQMHYFWWRSRLLWIQRNCLSYEKQILYKEVIYPDLWKTFRHFFLLSCFRKKTPENRQKANRNKAGLIGALHYCFGRFGNCPDWLRK